jgi:hypothetical protein
MIKALIFRWLPWKTAQSNVPGLSVDVDGVEDIAWRLMVRKRSTQANTWG